MTDLSAVPSRRSIDSETCDCAPLKDAVRRAEGISLEGEVAAELSLRFPK
jgi:hypothetical protein